MAKIYISEALQIVTDKVDSNDIETANKMLAVISKVLLSKEYKNRTQE